MNLIESFNGLEPVGRKFTSNEIKLPLSLMAAVIKKII
jgi:hypothetical protein